MKSTSVGGQKLDMANLDDEVMEKDGRHKNYKQSWIWERGKLALSNEKVERENINPIPTIREVENEPNGHMLRPKRRKWKEQARKKDKIEKKKSEIQNWPISAKRPVSEVREANEVPEANERKYVAQWSFQFSPHQDPNRNWLWK